MSAIALVLSLNGLLWLINLWAVHILMERAKIKIAHADWTLRERKSLRREKLEELFTSLNALSTWQRGVPRGILGEIPHHPNMQPLETVDTLVTLYFNEITTQLDAMKSKLLKGIHWCNTEASTLNSEVKKRDRPMGSFKRTQQWANHYGEVRSFRKTNVEHLLAQWHEKYDITSEITQIQSQAAQLMQDMVGLNSLKENSNTNQLLREGDARMRQPSRTSSIYRRLRHFRKPSR